MIVNLQIQEPIGFVQKEHNIQTQITRAINKTYIQKTSNTHKQNARRGKQKQYGRKSKSSSKTKAPSTGKINIF